MKIPFIKKIKQKSISFAQTIPSSMNGKPLWNNWNTENAIKHGFKASSVVYSCINLIAKSASSVPWYVYQKKGNKEWEIIEDHPLELLINRPNPFMSRKDLIERMTSHLYLGGNAVLTKLRANNIPGELWVMPPDSIKVVPSKTEFISHYLYEKDGIRQRLENQDVIHNKFIDPSNMFWGMSPIQALAKQIDTDVSALNWNKVSLQNRAITDGVFSFDQPLTKAQFEEARAMVREQHQGSENARTPWILGSGASWNQMSLNPIEMDFINTRKFTREELCSTFGVPPVMIGFYENATLANVETGRKIFWQDTLIPYLEDLKNCLNLSLTPDFGENIELSYDLSNVDALQENMTEKINNAKSLWSMGVPFNDVNQRLELGFDEIEGGDVGYLPSSLLPSDMTGQMFADTSEASNGQTNDEEEQPKGFTPDNKKNVNLENLKRLNFQSEEHKAFYWKSYERRRNTWYLNVTRKASSIYKKMGKQVAEAYKANGEKGALKAIDKFDDTWKKSLVAWWSEMIKEFGSLQFNELKHIKPSETKADEEEEVVFNPFRDDIQNYVLKMAAKKIKAINSSRKAEITHVIGSMLANEGTATIDEVAKEIVQKFDDLSRYSAYRIARTEVVGASNYGSYIGAKDTGLKLARIWVTSRDDRVREEHEKMDGQRIGLEESFDTPDGDSMMYPGDFNTKTPGNSINCRCVVAYEPI